MSAQSRRPTSGSGDVPLYVALAVIAIASLGLAYLALTGVHIGAGWISAPIPHSTPAETLVMPTASETPTAEPATSTQATPVGLLGGGPATWWNASVGAGVIPGIANGSLVGQGDATIAALRAATDNVVAVPGQAIVVQAGSEDLLEGASPSDVSVAIQGLWQSVREKGGRPIVALLPPSNVTPGPVLEVNGLIRAAATAQGVGVLDMTTPVADVDGAWAPGFSDDGQRPNNAGVEAMAQAAAAQLPILVTETSTAG